MPLFTQNRNPFALQRRRSNLPGQNGQENRPARQGGTDTLRLYPLEPTPTQHRANHNQRRQPQQQMRPPTSPVSRGSGNAALTRPEYTMAPPVMRGNTMAMQSPQPQPRHNAPDNIPITHNAVSRPHITQQPPNKPNAPAATQPPSPEQAANHFRRTNKGLPDGVRYEPLDENTMRLLRENGHLPPLEPPAAAQQVPQPLTAQHQNLAPTPITGHQNMPPVPSQPMQQATPGGFPSAIAPHPTATPQDMQAIAKTIEELIQDERNAQIFYGHLAKAAPEGMAASALADIAQDNLSHTDKFTQILAKQFSSNFVPVEAEINTGLELKDALALALEEENKTLRILAELLDGVANTEPERVIQRILNKKIVNYNRLERLYALS